MESEALLAGETEVDTQLFIDGDSSTQGRRAAGDSAKHAEHVHVGEESPLLSDNIHGAGDEEPQDAYGAFETDSRRPWRRPSIWWLLPFILLFTLGFGGLAVPRVNLILSLICRDYLSDRSAKDPDFTYLPVIIGEDNPYCRIPDVQSLVARFQLYMNLIAGILSALVSPRLGHLSDQYGRTRVIALGALGAVLNEAITVIVASWPAQISVNLLLAGSVFDGLGGSYTTAMALFYSYASDCTPPGKRNVAFGLFQGALFCGIAVGPALAALLIKKTGGPMVVFYIALLFHSIFCLSVFLIIPESLSKECQRAAREKHRLKPADESPSFSWGALNPMNLITPLSILLPAVGRPSALFPNRRGGSLALRRNIILLAAIDTAVFGVAMGTVQVIIIYAAYMFNWGNVESSLFVSTVNIVRVTTLLVVLPLVARIFRTPSYDDGRIRGSDILDVVIIRLSIIFDVLGYIGYAMSRHPSMMILSGVIASLGGMGSPILQSSLTKHVPHERIGQLLGATGLLHALARVVAPTISNLIYSLTVATFPQTVFLCLAAVFGVALLLSFFIRSHVGLEDELAENFGGEANEDGEDGQDQLLL